MSEEQIKQFKAATDDLVAVLTSPEMLERMRKFKDLEPGDRLEKASQLLSVEGLAEQGVKLPEGMRLSSRYFETDVTPMDKQIQGRDPRKHLEAIDPDFVGKLRVKHPQVFERLDKLPSSIFEGATIPGSERFSACGGAGGSIGGTGGCACGGASSLF